MATIKISDDLHDWLKDVQASLYLKYKKSLSQVKILLHIEETETQLDHETVADNIYKKMVETDKKEQNEKKTKLVSGHE